MTHATILALALATAWLALPAGAQDAPGRENPVEYMCQQGERLEACLEAQEESGDIPFFVFLPEFPAKTELRLPVRCDMTYGISKTGRTMNVVADCDDDRFADTAIEALWKWRFVPWLDKTGNLANRVGPPLAFVFTEEGVEVEGP